MRCLRVSGDAPMKKHIIPILVGLLVVSQIFSHWRIGQLEDEMVSMRQGFQHENNITNTLMDNSYGSLRDMIEEKASILAKQSVEFGTEIHDGYMVDVAISLTPKVVKEGMVATLSINGQEIVMTQSETSFSAITTVSAFATEPLATVALQTGDTKEIETLEPVFGLIEVVPMGWAFFQNDRSSILDEGTAHILGYASIGWEIPQSGIDYTDVIFSIFVDGDLTVSEVVDLDLRDEGGMIDYPVNQLVSVKDGQVIELAITATDEMGYVHQHVMLRWSMGELDWMSNTGMGTIFAPDGTEVWSNG